MNGNQSLIPTVCVIAGIVDETPDVKTFYITGQNGEKPFEHLPGQCAMLSIPGEGEAMFSITSAPCRKDRLEFSVKRCGSFTDRLHESSEGDRILLRGPYGRPFPISDFENEDLLFIAGGIGLAPIRSVIDQCLSEREKYGDIKIIYGARSSDDLVFKESLFGKWKNAAGTETFVTVDRGDGGWNGHVGFVPAYVSEVCTGNKPVAILCGPPVMIKFTLAELTKLGFEKYRVYTTLEMKMKCGIGKCGRCNIGSKYVCRDGPVFRLDELEELPDEY
jgi:NAD(P)H-flavin reductase